MGVNVNEAEISTDALDAEIRSDQHDQAGDCINRHTIMAAAGGLIPVPFVEMAAVSTIQLRMIAKLCDIYEIKFSEHAVKNSIGTLLATVLPVSGVGYAASAFLRGVPLVGSVFGMVAMPSLFAASTYALGRVFSWHFSKGGTIGNFDAEKMKDRFKEEFEAGKRKVTNLVKRNKPDAPAAAAAT